MKPLAGGAIDDAPIAMRFIASNPNVTVVIPGMAAKEEIQQNLQSVSDTSALTPAEQEKVQKIRDFLGTNFCRRCNYCAPCAAGINIPLIFLIEGYFSRYDLKEWAQMRYRNAEKKASACIECGACETRCPYHLPIREMMKKVKEVFGE